MKFCPKCGTRLRLKSVKGASTTYQLICERCGYNEVPHVITTHVFQPQGATVKLVDKNLSELKTLPVTRAECPQCGHDEATWWIVQTRGGDEPSTQFYRCLKCNYTWRQYS
jgi:DNA-directed RNA polymerase subunit M